MKCTKTKIGCLLVGLLAAGLLTSCAHNGDDMGNDIDTNGPAYQVQTTAQVQASLEQAAGSVSKSLNSLSAIRRSAYPENDKMPYANLPTNTALREKVAIQWYGPIQTVVQKIAHQIGYTMQTYGKVPPTPILVDINTLRDPQPAVAVLQNIDLQAGLNASVLIFPKQSLISLRYLG